jgi:archaellum component FlaC
MIFRHGKAKHYILGRYDKIEDDVNWIKSEITEVAKEINSIRNLKAKLLDIEVKLIREA